MSKDSENNVTEVSTTEEKVEVTQPNVVEKKQKPKWLIPAIVGALIILIIAIGLGTNSSNENNSESKKKQSTKLESITLKVDDEIAINESKLIKVEFEPEDKEEEITWESSDETIATVEDGTVKSLSTGNVKITATTKSGISKSVTITVYQPATDFSISETSIQMYVGDEKQLTSSIKPDDATYKNVNWKSSNSSVVSVDENGKLVAKSIGETKITAKTEEGLSKECSVVVKEKPIEYSGSGDKIISNVNIPAGEYVATITVNSTRHYAVKFYYGQNDYDYELLVNNSGKTYKGTTFLKGGSTDAVTNGMFQIEAQGSWTIKVEKLTGTATFPISGNGDMVTGLFEGTGNREVFNIKYNSTRHHAVKIYKYNGAEYDYELLVNDSGKAYNGQVMAPTEKGAKYFFVVEGEGDWSIERQ